MRSLVISAALLATQSAMAAVPIDGWYGSIFGGYAYLPPNISINSFGLTRTEPLYGPGYNAGGRIGYQSFPLRYEAEVTYINANLSDFYLNQIEQVGVTGHGAAVTAMANVYYDFPEIVPAIMPFLGLGLGYAWVEGVLQSTGPGFGPSYYKGNNNVVAYQATAGVTYNFSENYAANLSYRFVGTGRADNLGEMFQAHLGSLGIIYRFDDGSYK